MSGGLRLVSVLGGTLSGLWGSEAALAQEYPPQIPRVSPAGIERLPNGQPTAGAEVAFTGADITIWMLLLVVLALAGVALLLLGKLRARV
jgi:hypothetical protein